MIAQTDNDFDCKSAVKVKESLGYWQDILWLGSDEDVKAMFKDKGIAEKCENISNIYTRLLSA